MAYPRCNYKTSAKVQKGHLYPCPQRAQQAGRPGGKRNLRCLQKLGYTFKVRLSTSRRPYLKNKGGGKSGQHRAKQLLTATKGNFRESATETIPLLVERRR